MKSTARISRIFKIGDVVRVPFPFVKRERMQARPALIISNPVGPDSRLLWTLMITSARRGSWPGDLDVGTLHAEYGLPIRCYVRTAKIAALDMQTIERSEGRLPDGLMNNVRKQMRLALGW